MNKIEQLWTMHWVLLVATFVGIIIGDKPYYGLAFFAIMGINDIALNNEFRKDQLHKVKEK